MQIRKAESGDRNEIVDLYIRSQEATGLPDPDFLPVNKLGDHLYARHALERCVAIDMGRIVGHALVELPNPEHLKIWRNGLSAEQADKILELGGAFVEPTLGRAGIWTALLIHRLDLVRAKYENIPVSATWTCNDHVKKRFAKLGGKKVGEQLTGGGPVSLYVF
ncbi:hypothetical protein EOL96_02035 [Candidatus Saccharibacteria bacterium]|nr:hypothetical protein [Candidatus Saccharibacteria bacterium]